MKKGKREKSKARAIILTLAAVLFTLFVLLPISLSIFNGSKMGNVALIPIEGVISSNGYKSLGQSTVSSQPIIDYINEANENTKIKAIVIEINSPGGTPVASDEIATAIKKANKPTVALIREVGASGGYWVASATDYIIANKMSITGSIGVLSSYLDFSGLMKDYGVTYQRLVAGKYKDVGSPFKELNNEEKNILQSKIDKVHDIFVKEIAQNRNLAVEEVRALATGEFYLGIEALDLGLIDQLGDIDTTEKYLTKVVGLEEVNYVLYQREVGIFEMLTGVFSDFFFNIGEGFGATLQKSNDVMLI